MKMLTAQTAELLTASVTVKSLTIQGRQVTLAVFRQLLEEDIFDGAKLKGVGWGHVNYLVDRADQIHLVWQKGSELRRCLVTEREYLKTRNYEAAKKKPCVAFHAQSRIPGEVLPSLDWEWANPPEPLQLECSDRSGGSAEEWKVWLAADDRAIAAYEERVREHLEREWTAHCVYVRDRNAVAAALFELPQLFIAV